MCFLRTLKEVAIHFKRKKRNRLMFHFKAAILLYTLLHKTFSPIFNVLKILFLTYVKNRTMSPWHTVTQCK